MLLSRYFTCRSRAPIAKIATNLFVYLPQFTVYPIARYKDDNMEHNEGRELVEYALIAVLVSLGVTLMLSGAGDQIANIWNIVANFVLS